MGTATAVPVKSRATTKRMVTATILKAWLTDLRSGKYTLRNNKKHGIQFLVAVGDTATKYEWDAFGLLFDRVADEWKLVRKSSANKETYYYRPMIGGSEVKLESLLPNMVIQRLIDLSRAGASGGQMANYIESQKALILG